LYRESAERIEFRHSDDLALFDEGDELRRLGPSAGSSAGRAEAAEELLILPTPGCLDLTALPHSPDELADEDTERHEEDDSEHDSILDRPPILGYRRRASLAP
jgi:hypothetical protein